MERCAGFRYFRFLQDPVHPLRVPETHGPEDGHGYLESGVAEPAVLAFAGFKGTLEVRREVFGEMKRYPCHFVGKGAKILLWLDN